MYKIITVLCIIGCTLAKEKAISPSESSRRLKTRQVGSVYGLEHYYEPVHHVVDYLHDPQVVGSAVHYVEPSVVPLSSVHTAAPLVHHVNAAPQVYSYVPSVGYGHSYSYRYNPGSLTPLTVYSRGSSQQISRTQPAQPAVFSEFTQQSENQQSAQVAQQVEIPQDVQPSSFAQGTQQSSVSQENQATALVQGTQQGMESSLSQRKHQLASQSEVQSAGRQTLTGQLNQQTEAQQFDRSQSSQGSLQNPSQPNERFQFGVLHSGFGQQQQFGIVQTPSNQRAESRLNFGQAQETMNDQTGNLQSVFGGSQQSSSTSGQQTSGSFSSSNAVSTVAVARQQSPSSETTIQQTGGSPFPASSSFGSQTFGFPATQGSPNVRLIQPFNLSPSYAIHGLGFRTIQSGTPGSGQISSYGSSQQFTPATSGFQFSTQDQSSGSLDSIQGENFRSETTNPSGIQYSFTSQQSVSQPATVRSGGQSSISSPAQGSSTSAIGQIQGSLSSFRSSFNGQASQGSASGSQNSSPTQQPPAILRMSNDLSYDGSFTYGFESENGISSSAVGSLRTVDAAHPAQIISGSYSYTAPDGTPISTNYYADETGFHAQGAHLPTPHPMPDYIARSLEVLPQQGNREQAQPTVESN